MLNIVLPVAGLLVATAIMKEAKWHRKLRKRERKDLPNAPGVYIFYSRWGKVVHVGHSGNLKARISPGHIHYQNMYKFDYRECRSKRAAFRREMRLQKRLGYNGR